MLLNTHFNCCTSCSHPRSQTSTCATMRGRAWCAGPLFYCWQAAERKAQAEIAEAGMEFQSKLGLETHLSPAEPPILQPKPTKLQSVDTLNTEPSSLPLLPRTDTLNSKPSSLTHPNSRISRTLKFKPSSFDLFRPTHPNPKSQAQSHHAEKQSLMSSTQITQASLSSLENSLRA